MNKTDNLGWLKHLRRCVTPSYFEACVIVAVRLHCNCSAIRCCGACWSKMEVEVERRTLTLTFGVICCGEAVAWAQSWQNGEDSLQRWCLATW